MPLVLKDRVRETTTTTSTGAYTLAGAVTGYQSFSVVGDGNTTYYTVTDGTDWEVGIGTYTASGTTLSRDTILASSNSGNAVSWGAGNKDVFLTYPAERSVYVDGSDIVPATAASYSGNVTTIQLRFSSTPGATPSAVSLSAGELVVNTADGKLYFKDSGGTVKVLSQANQIAPLTTKGDLIANDGTSNIRLPVGTDGYVLTADSTFDAGIKWAASGGFTSPVLIDVNSASTALEIRQTGSGNALLVEDDSNPDATPTVIDQYGNLILGKSTRQSSIDNKIEVHSQSDEFYGIYPSAGFYNWATDSTFQSSFSFFHFPSGVVGTLAGNSSGDSIGRINWWTRTSLGDFYSANITGNTASTLNAVDLTYTANSHSFSGAITSGTWNGSAIDVAYGGTGQTTKTAAFDALSPATTKGDLIVDNGTNNVRLPVGTNGYVLTADSTATEGLKWAAAGGGGGGSSAGSNIFLANNFGGF